MNDHEVLRQIQQKERELQELKDAVLKRKASSISAYTYPRTSRFSRDSPEHEVEVPTSPDPQRQTAAPSTPPSRRTPPSKRTSPSKKITPARIKLGLHPKKAHEVTLKKSTPSSFADKIQKHRSDQIKEHSDKQLLEQLRTYKFGTRSNVGVSQQKKSSTSNISTIESFSKLSVTDRYLDHSTLEDEFRDKKILSVSQVYAKVYPPEYKPLSYPNYVVMGIVVKKSQVKMSRSDTKYIMITLTDLRMDISFAIHRSAFDSYWKIREGTVIAILNPEIYTTWDETVASGDTPTAAKTMGLSVSKSDDCILEIARAKDLGRCSAQNAKGTQCLNWVDSSKATFCEYHVGLGMKRAGQKRMEFNSTANKMFSPTKKGKKQYYIEGGNGKSQIMTDRSRSYPAPARNAVPPEFFGEDRMEDPKKAEKRLQKRISRYKKEQETRDKLSRRPEGILLRRYDEKGKLLEGENFEEQERQKNKGGKLFNAKQIRVLGFDPTKHAGFGKVINFDGLGKKNLDSVNLKKPKVAAAVNTVKASDDDDDLEII